MSVLRRQAHGYRQVVLQSAVSRVQGLQAETADDGHQAQVLRVLRAQRDSAITLFESSVVAQSDFWSSAKLEEPLQSTDGSTVQQNVARAETLVPRGADPPKRKTEEEPTFRLRRKMGLV